MQLSLNHKSRGEASLSTCPGPSLSPPLLPSPPSQIRPPATSAPAAPIPGGVDLLGSSAPARRQQVTFPSSICDFKIEMSQSKEVRYTARSITPPANRDGTSKSPPPKRRSTSRSPPPKRSASRSPRPRSPRRHSTSRSPRPRRRGRSRSRSRDRSRSRSGDDLRNPGNNLYVTGLSTRVTEADLEKFFSKEGKVQSCHVVLDPRTKESRGFAFVTMDSVDDARRCIKYLHRTVLEGRLVSVEKAKRTRERTPTPGKYCGRRGGSERRSRSPSPYRSRRRERSRSRDHRRERSRRRDRSRSRDRRGSSPHERDSYRRRGDRSRSPTSNGNHRKD